MNEVGASGFTEAIFSVDLIKLGSCRDGLIALEYGH